MAQCNDIKAPDHGPDAAIVVTPRPVQGAVLKKVVPTTRIGVDGHIDCLQRIGAVHADAVQVIEDNLGPFRVGKAAEHGQSVAKAITLRGGVAVGNPRDVIVRTGGVASHVVGVHPTIIPLTYFFQAIGKMVRIPTTVHPHQFIHPLTDDAGIAQRCPLWGRHNAHKVFHRPDSQRTRAHCHRAQCPAP